MTKTTWIHGLWSDRSPELRLERRGKKGATRTSPTPDSDHSIPPLPPLA